MKQILLFLVMISITFVNAQNVGINTTNPTENLHIRTDSSKIAIRLDNKKSVENGYNYFTAIGTPTSVENIVIQPTNIDWTDLIAGKMVNADNVSLQSPNLNIWPEIANNLRIYFDFSPDGIPSTAELTDITLHAEWKRNGTGAGELRTYITMYQAINTLPLVNFGFARITSSTDIEVSLSKKEIYNPITADMLNLNDIFVGLQALHSVSAGLSRLEIDKLWLEVEYRLPANGTENVFWTAGAKEGDFLITNSADLGSDEYLKIDETGVTQLKGLKIVKNAGPNRFLTSDEEGRASWADLPTQSDLLWINKNDTAMYASGPVQIHNNIGQAALIFDKGENRLNNSFNFAETDNRIFNVIIDADNDQTNEQFNIYRDSTQFNSEAPAVRVHLDGGDSWINGGGKMGIGTDIPSQRLDVNGAIKLANSQGNVQAGTMRWNPEIKDFEGYNGAKWLSLTTNIGWGTKAGEEDQFFDGVNNFARVVDIHGGDAVVLSQDSVIFYNFDGSIWAKNSSFFLVGSASYLTLHNDYAAFREVSQVSIYHKVNDTWTFEYAIPSSNQAQSIDLYNDIIVYGEDNNEKAYVYIRSGTTWSVIDTLVASDGLAGDSFGGNVSVFGNFIAVSATNKNNSKGAVYVYEKTGNNWNEVAILEANDGQESDFFGNDIDLKSNYLIVGAYSDDENGLSSLGSAYIFKNNNGTWSQQTKLNPSNAAEGDFCGYSVKLNAAGTNAVVGCPQIASLYPANPYDNGNGKVLVFDRSGTLWSESITLTTSDGQINDGFGHSTSIHNNAIIIGAPGKSNNNGGVYFFQDH